LLLLYLAVQGLLMGHKVTCVSSHLLQMLGQKQLQGHQQKV
jgi:hypothetical protein